MAHTTRNTRDTERMARTPEQVAADDALTVAVQTAAIQYGFAPDAIVTDYIVVLSAQTWDTAGDHHQRRRGPAPRRIHARLPSPWPGPARH